MSDGKCVITEFANAITTLHDCISHRCHHPWSCAEQIFSKSTVTLVMCVVYYLHIICSSTSHLSLQSDSQSVLSTFLELSVWCHKLCCLVMLMLSLLWSHLWSDLLCIKQDVKLAVWLVCMLQLVSWVIVSVSLYETGQKIPKWKLMVHIYNKLDNSIIICHVHIVQILICLFL